MPLASAAAAFEPHPFVLFQIKAPEDPTRVRVFEDRAGFLFAIIGVLVLIVSVAVIAFPPDVSRAFEAVQLFPVAAGLILVLASGKRTFVIDRTARKLYKYEG